MFLSIEIYTIQVQNAMWKDFLLWIWIDGTFALLLLVSFALHLNWFALIGWDLHFNDFAKCGCMSFTCRYDIVLCLLMFVGDVFGYLCKNLGTEWEFFIRRLPVLPPVQSSEMKALVDHAKMERPDTQNRIDACLIGWKKKCVECVTIGNIVESLQYVGRNDLAEKVEKRDLII